MRKYKAMGRHFNSISYNDDCDVKQKQVLEAKMATVEKSNNR